MRKRSGSLSAILLLVDEGVLLLIEFIEVTLAVVVEEELLVGVDVSLGE
jgi:hypothetical protein